MCKRKKEKPWYEIAKKLKRKKKLDEPYLTLFDYLCEISFASYANKDSCHSHFLYLKYHDFHGDLDNVCANLNKILPYEFSDNFDRALQKYPLLKYRDLGDEPDECDDEDMFVDDRRPELEEILQHFITAKMQSEKKK